MLCDLCSTIPFKLFRWEGTFMHFTSYRLKISAAGGCALCVLILDSFEIQYRRGRVRFRPGSELSLPIILAATPSLGPHAESMQLLYGNEKGESNGEPQAGFLHLLYGDDIGASNGERLRITFSKGHGEDICDITSSDT
jgi:hypothetical protein